MEIPEDNQNIQRNILEVLFSNQCKNLQVLLFTEKVANCNAFAYADIHDTRLRNLMAPCSHYFIQLQVYRLPMLCLDNQG